MQKIVAKINLKAIEDNAKAFRKLTGAKLCAVVKADAYGHGAEAVVNALSGEADFFAVAIAEEAASVRVAACGKDILVLTPPANEEQLVYMAENGFVASLPDLSTAKNALKVCLEKGKTLRVHLQANTGMNRYGMNPSMLGKVCALLKGSPVKVCGLYSHLYEHSRPACEEQRRLFLSMKKICARYYPSDVIYHLSATYGALLGKEFAFDAVRVGIGLYGYLPDGGVDAANGKIRLRRAMKVYAEAVESRRYAFGGAGYGRLSRGAEKALETSPYTTTFRVGYADGFPRGEGFGMRGVLRGGEKNLSPLCMDSCIRLGKRKKGASTLVLSDAEEAAKNAGTIVYEVLCAATRRAEFEYDYR